MLKELIQKFEKFADKKCNTTSYPNGCPDGTKCSQSLQTNSPHTGECKCIGDNNEFNINYENDNDYCVYVEPKHFDNRVMASKSSSTSEDAVSDRIEPHSSHHIIGGILISICLVVIFTLIVIGVKKLQIKQRIRNMRMTQRNRPLYEDVMLGNDNDDPPLI